MEVYKEPDENQEVPEGLPKYGDSVQNYRDFRANLTGSHLPEYQKPKLPVVKNYKGDHAYYECENPIDKEGLMLGGSESDEDDPFKDEEWHYNADGSSYQKLSKKKQRLSDDRQMIQKALTNYELLYKLEPGTATVDMVQKTSAGIEGFS